MRKKSARADVVALPVDPLASRAKRRLRVAVLVLGESDRAGRMTVGSADDGTIARWPRVAVVAVVAVGLAGRIGVEPAFVIFCNLELGPAGVAEGAVLSAKPRSRNAATLGLPDIDLDVDGRPSGPVLRMKSASSAVGVLPCRSF